MVAFASKNLCCRDLEADRFAMEVIKMIASNGKSSFVETGDYMLKCLPYIISGHSKNCYCSETIE